MPELLKRIPTTIENYLFVGGGALFFEIYERVRHAYLSDLNAELVTTYNVIKNNPYALIDLLKKHQDKHSKAYYYYAMRSQRNLPDPVQIAARFLYLNRTCFNGLYRVNKKGEFNVPQGRYNKPAIVDEQNILLCHMALQKATILNHSYERITPQEGDFVYFDPPYHPINSTSFTEYTRAGFAGKDQLQLRDFASKISGEKVNVMLSNSDATLVEVLY